MTLFRKEAGDSLFTGTRLAPANAYELDYNTGAAAGIAEMLLQSHAGCLDLLPALPRAWADGAVSGLRARGGFEVAIRWENHRLKEARLISTRGGPCRVRHVNGLVVSRAAEVAPIQSVEYEDFAFDTRPGETYLIRLSDGKGEGSA